jgi:hypothetical protein
MPVFAEMLTAIGKFSINYANLMLPGIKPEQFARKPRVETSAGAKIIDTNHPAFVFGHLSIYPTRLVTLTGDDGKKAEAPAAFTDLFKAGAPCQDDPEGRIYPKMEELTAEFTRTYAALLEHLRGVPDEIFQRENPNAQARDRFPTIGVLASFYLGSHMMMHLGQISAWRRCMGLPSAM